MEDRWLRLPPNPNEGRLVMREMARWPLRSPRCLRRRHAAFGVNTKYSGLESVVALQLIRDHPAFGHILLLLSPQLGKVLQMLQICWMTGLLLICTRF